MLCVWGREWGTVGLWECLFWKTLCVCVWMWVKKCTTTTVSNSSIALKISMSDLHLAQKYAANYPFIFHSFFWAIHFNLFNKPKSLKECLINCLIHNIGFFWSMLKIICMINLTNLRFKLIRGFLPFFDKLKFVKNELHGR